ncbi:MAG: hypothetical protein ACTSUB_04395, partial [Candidatus Thorarchaeota archaeon]
HEMSVSVDDSLADKSIPDMSEFSRLDKILKALIESKVQDSDTNSRFDEHENTSEDEQEDHEATEELKRLSNATEQAGIDDTLKISEIHEDGSIMELDHVTTGLDSVGGIVVYVVLKLGNKIHKIPVTQHFHSIREIGRMSKDKLASSIESELDEYNLSEKDLNRAIKECIVIMRSEKLLKGLGK